MKYKITVEVESNTYLEKDLNLKYDDYEIEIFSNDKNIINKIAISKLIDTNMIPSFGVTAPNHVKIKMSGKNKDEIVNLLQYIESTSSFWFDINRIHWNRPKEEWIPADDHERAMLSLSGFEMSRKHDFPPIKFEPKIFTNTLKNKNKYDYLTIPLAFRREGMIEHNSFRFINAFFNFYFYLEGLYASGKTKNIQVKEEFIKSLHINEVLNNIIAKYRHEKNKKNLINIEKYLIHKKWTLNNENIIKVIVSMRGQLHHYSVKSTRIQGHPLNHDNYEAISLLLMHMCNFTYPLILRDGAPK